MNVSKTKVLIFNQKNNKKGNDNNIVFTYDSKMVEVVEEFKYLGIQIHSSKRYQASIDYRIKQGRRLQTPRTRRCQIWRFKPDIVMKQFKTCVLPAMEYGVGIYGG